MKIIVCVKAVPGYLVDQKTDSLVLNPYDLYTVQKITDKKKQFGWEVTCLCMGPLGAQDALRRCYAMGADRVILLSDPHFAGSDTYATAFILSQALRKLDFDVLICGHEAVDGETRQVPCGIASNLGYIYISNVIDLTEKKEGELLIQCQEENELRTLRAATPIVLSFLDYSTSSNISLMALKRSREQEILIWNREMLGLSEEDCGQRGSKTRVLRSKNAVEDHNKETEIIEGTATDKCNFILRMLEEYLG
jgi:electron transfer flavoprotein beta subunit